jgi:formylmethanofuran dehydrogenase subunit E
LRSLRKNLCTLCGEKVFSNRKVRKGKNGKYAKAGYTKSLAPADFLALFAKNLCALCGEKVFSNRKVRKGRLYKPKMSIRI